MTLRAAVFFIALSWPTVSFAADDVGALLDKALDQLVRNGYVGDTSAAERYLQAILEQQPAHLEAQWQLIYIRLVPLVNMPLVDRAAPLAAISPAFDRLAKLATQSRRRAFLHFITATYASFYNAYERALSEIDKAIVLEPQSVRYLTAKGRLLIDYGKWTKHDVGIDRGIALLTRARVLLQKAPSPFVRDENYDFYLASAYADLSRPRWKEAAEHYQRFIERADRSVGYAFALNNASIAYRELGACDKAKEAAEQALQVATFGAAEQNKRYAEFCLELQKMGLMAK